MNQADIIITSGQETFEKNNKFIQLNKQTTKSGQRMKPNFDISLPSIPGKTIKFKIQDIKQTSFGSRKQRFQDNKKNLTKKFIDSFSNFHEPKDQSRLQQQTQASQSNSRISVRSVAITQQQKEKRFRHMIPQDRKHIISVYEKYRDYEKPILGQSKFDKGYTFHRAGKQVVKGKQQEEQQINSKWTRKFVTDNYYFTQTVLEPQPIAEEDTTELVLMTKKEEKTPKKREKPSATFKNQTRERALDRIYKNQVPGPGSYISLTQTQTKQRQIRSLTQKQLSNKPAQHDYKKLKQIITSVVGQSHQYQQQEFKQDDAKKQRLQHMFIKDDRDRFGQQKYPISSKVNVPGPGAYDIMNGIEEQARKVSLVEEQRKLLKEWFNN